MRLEAPWTTVRRLFSSQVAIQNAAANGFKAQQAERDVEDLVNRINGRIITFSERTRRRVNE